MHEWVYSCVSRHYDVRRASSRYQTDLAQLRRASLTDTRILGGMEASNSDANDILRKIVQQNRSSTWIEVTDCYTLKSWRKLVHIGKNDESL